MKVEIQDIDGLCAQFKEIYKSASIVRKEIDNSYDDVVWVNKYRHEIEPIIEEYNDAIRQFAVITSSTNSKVTLNHIPLFITNNNQNWEDTEEGRREYLISNLVKIKIECKKAIGFLERLGLPKLTNEQIDKLGWLRQELENIEGIDPNYEKNLYIAISEYEEGYFLGSVLVSSRVISHCIDKIPGEKDEDKIESLVKTNIIDKDRKDTKTSVIKASRQARNFLSHKVVGFPTPDEALSLLSDGIRIVKLLTEFQKVEKMGKEVENAK